MSELDRQCNDNGDYGVCTFCGHLHTVTITKACFICSNSVEVPGEDHCPKCIEKMRAGKPKARMPAAIELGP